MSKEDQSVNRDGAGPPGPEESYSYFRRHFDAT